MRSDANFGIGIAKIQVKEIDVAKIQEKRGERNWQKFLSISSIGLSKFNFYFGVLVSFFSSLDFLLVEFR